MKEIKEINVKIKGAPEEVSRIKEAIIKTRNMAKIKILEVLSEKEENTVSLDGRVLADCFFGHTVCIGIAKGEPYEDCDGRRVIDKYVQVFESHDLLDPYQLDTNPAGTFDLAQCSNASNKQIALLRKVIYENGFVWDAKKKQLIDINEFRTILPDELTHS